MPIYMPEEKTFELCPAGTHVGTCFRVVDLGTQNGSYGQQRQILISWELQDERMADGRPFTVGRRYNFSADRKSTLRTDVEGWLGRVLTAADFGQLNLGDLLGCTCTLGIKHNRVGERTYANIVSVMQAPKGTPPRLSVINGAVSFSLDDRPFAYSDFDALPQWLQDVIRKSPEYQRATNVRQQTGTTAQRLAAVLGSPPINQFNDEIPL
jgi:hypothetical protein